MARNAGEQFILKPGPLEQNGQRAGARRVKVIKLLELLILLAMLGIMLVVGFASTRLLISDGVEQFSGAERAAAEDVLGWAYTWADHPIERALSLKIQVKAVEFVPGRCPARAFSTLYNYRVALRFYTLFGIPTWTASICGDQLEWQ